MKLTMNQKMQKMSIEAALEYTERIKTKLLNIGLMSRDCPGAKYKSMDSIHTQLYLVNLELVDFMKEYNQSVLDQGGA
jgi:hypothetical protein